MHILKIVGIALIIAVIIVGGKLFRGISCLQKEIDQEADDTLSSRGISPDTTGENRPPSLDLWQHKACEKCYSQVGTINITGNILMIILKGYLGVVGGSKGLIADAIHSCADLLATIVMIIGLRISGQEKDEKYPYGYGKAEHIVAIVIYLFLFFIAGYIIYDASMAIIQGRLVIPCTVAVWGAIFSVAINELMFRMTLCAGEQANSPSLIAKAWESRTDVYSSIAVIIGILGARMGFHFMDPLAAMVVGMLILRMCVAMSKGAVLALMDKTPENVSTGNACEILNTMLAGNVVEVRNVKAREVGAFVDYLVEVSVPDCITIVTADEIKKEIIDKVKTLDERKSTVTVQLFPFETTEAV